MYILYLYYMNVDSMAAEIERLNIRKMLSAKAKKKKKLKNTTLSPCEGCVNVSELQCGRQQVLSDIR